MQLPDLEEGLLLAQLVLRVDRVAVLNLVRLERLHKAIMAPTAHAEGVPMYTTRPEIAKSLLVECALGRILPTPEFDFEFAWLMTQRAIKLSHCKWRWPSGHRVRMEAFRQSLVEGEDPGHDLVVWLGQGIQPPFRPPPDEVEKSIYVASPMHPAPAANMGEWATAVDEGLKQFLARKETEMAFTHRPQIFPIVSASGANRREETERRIHTADGLVVLAPHSSWGAAIELIEGLRVGIPTLFIHPSDAPPSQRARSYLEEAEATILEFEGDLDEKETLRAIEGLVFQWLDGWYSLILSSRRRRECMETRNGRFLAAINTKRTQMDSLEEKKALAAAGLPARRARTLLDEPWGLLSATMVEMVALGNAYEVPANLDAIVDEPAPDRPLFLTPREQSTLDSFATDKELSVSDTIELAVAGQREIVKPGRRRKLFTDSSQWEELRARVLGS